MYINCILDYIHSEILQKVDIANCNRKVDIAICKLQSKSRQSTL